MASSNTSLTKKDIRKIITASSAGTLIKWYDLYIFAGLSTPIAAHFFPKGNPTAATLATLAIFAAGFLVRPFGALVFPRPGELIGWKYTFLLPLIIMGGSTFAIGLVPGYERIGIAAPLLILLLRLLQGLALGGEDDGAVRDVAAHSPDQRRGFYTSWVQATAAIGLLLGGGIILLTRHFLDADTTRSIGKFDDWGWRIPFLFSILLLALSIYIRLKMRESPLFQPRRSGDGLSVTPPKGSVGHTANWKLVLLALFGATMGQGIVFYTGQFYVQTFMENTCLLDFDQAKTTLVLATLVASPFFVVFGGWSDRVGRKWIMMAGMLLAVPTYPYLFKQLLVISDPRTRTEFAEQKEIRNSVAFVGPKSRDMVRSSTTISRYEGGMLVTETKKDTVYADGHPTMKPVTTVSRTLGSTDYWKVTVILFVMVGCIAMVVGPIAAFLIELFPTRNGHTPLSLPDQIGNGVFGGVTPFVGLLLTTLYPGDPLAGRWYTVIGTGLCLIIGALFIPNKKKAPAL